MNHKRQVKGRVFYTDFEFDISGCDDLEATVIFESEDTEESFELKAKDAVLHEFHIKYGVWQSESVILLKD